MSVFKATLKSTLGKLGAQVKAGFERADELGGEVRDYVQERVASSERAQHVIQRIRALRGADDPLAERKAAAAQAHAEATSAAPPPSAADVAADEARKGLGDPGLPAQIYGRSSCPWTGRAITVLEAKKIDYDFIDMDDPDHVHYEGKLVPETKQNTVPYIYLRGEFIGGFNALSEYARLGQLEYLVMSAEEKKSANPALERVVVVPRPNTDEVAPGEA
jgi:glutaredoxin